MGKLTLIPLLWHPSDHTSFLYSCTFVNIFKNRQKWLFHKHRVWINLCFLTFYSNSSYMFFLVFHVTSENKIIYKIPTLAELCLTVSHPFSSHAH
jgi:hypothetical protein